MDLTICYMTNRRDCRMDWFLDSLERQKKELGLDGYEVTVVAVDFYAEEREWRKLIHKVTKFPFNLPDQWVTPKASVWQGPHRRTTKDYFAASNARNTGLLYAGDGLVAFVDDLSVLLPGWLEQALSCRRGQVLLGRYAKVRELVVEDGLVKSCTPFDQGVDSRQAHVPLDRRTRVEGGWVYGCSLVGHVEDFLNVNGFDEDCDSMGAEDYIFGIMLEKSGVELYYEPRMMTFESEELHHAEPPMARIIKAHGPESKFKEIDASHAILHMVRHGGRHRAPNYMDLRVERALVLAGGDPPVVLVPEHDWRDGQPLSEM